jgi:spore germination protein KC
MRKLKLAIKALMLLCILLALNGCWDNKDINHRILPVVMGISKVDKEYKVVLQIPQPVENTTQIRIITRTGKTVTEAVDKISENMESRVDLLHLKVILIEKKYAQQGVKDIISGFMRGQDVSPKALVVICDEDLDLFFAKVKKFMKPEGTTLYDFFEKNAGWNPQIALTRVWQVYRSIHSYTRDVAIPIIKSGESTLVEHLGSAIIRNGKMVDRMNTDETLLFNAFDGQSTQGKIEVMDHASVLIVSNTMSNESKLIGKRPYMKSRINLKVSILEVKDDASTDLIKQELEKLLTKRFYHMFTKTQAKKADIMGLGQYYRNKLPREELEHWRNEYYPYLQLDLEIHAIIQNEGGLKTPSDL